MARPKKPENRRYRVTIKIVNGPLLDRYIDGMDETRKFISDVYDNGLTIGDMDELTNVTRYPASRIHHISAHLQP